MVVEYFTGFKNAPEDCYTKNVLNTDFGLKPLNDEIPDAQGKVYIHGNWRLVSTYHIDNCKEIKRRVVKEYDLTIQNIAESLYLINKSAKISRDTKQLKYENRKHAIVKSAKTRQEKLYSLKNKALNKLVEEGIAETLGYHTFNDSNYILLKVDKFTFHQFSHNVKDLSFLGDIEGKISSEKTATTNLKFHEAVSVIERFIANGGDIK